MKNFISLSDEHLLELYLAGNTAALETIIYRYKSRIYTAINLLVKDKSLADDILQDTFIKVIHSIKNIKYMKVARSYPG